MVKILNFSIKFIFIFFIFGCHSNDNNKWNDLKKNEPQPEEKKEESFSDKLLVLHNRQRELRGRVGLSINNDLMLYAQKHAKWMAYRNLLKHSDISVLMGKFHTAGENIAWNQENEYEVVDAWMKSNGHRENIINRQFSKVGFGLLPANDGSLYWCTVFGD